MSYVLWNTTILNKDSQHWENIYVEEYSLRPRPTDTFQPNKRHIFPIRVNVVFQICINYFANINPCLLKLVISLSCRSASARQKNPDVTIMAAARALSAPSHRANRSVN